MEQQKMLLCELGRRLWSRGYVASNDGNLSLKVSDHCFLVTPSGVSKGALQPEMLLLVDELGQLVAPSSYNASSELPMHLCCYRVRPDVGGVVHAHPPAATAFACARQPIDQPVLGEFLMTLGEVPVAPYGRTGTTEIPAAIEPLLPGHDGILLANHGALTVGPDLLHAYYQMERLEQTAQIYLNVKCLGGGVPLPAKEVEALRGIGQR